MLFFHSSFVLLWLVLHVASDPPDPNPKPADGTGQGSNPATGTVQGSTPATGSTVQDSGRVIVWHDAVAETQVSMWWRKDVASQGVNQVYADISTPKKDKFIVVCSEYKTESPRLMVFYQGTFLDLIALYPRQDPCARNMFPFYVTPQDPVRKGSRLEVKLRYLWAGKKPRCVERWYIVSQDAVKSSVERSDYPVVDCVDYVNKFVKQFGTGLEAGGVVNVGPMGVFTSANGGGGKTLPRVKLEIRKDFKGKSIFLHCDKTILDEPDADGRTERIMTHISHEDFDIFPVDHLQLESCKKDSLNINRRIVGEGLNIFKLLFKAIDDKCYERSIYMYRFLYFYYYETVATIRESPLEVDCPSAFAEDIGMNVKAPWYMRVYQKEDKFEKEIKGAATPDPTWVN